VKDLLEASGEFADCNELNIPSPPVQTAPSIYGKMF